MAHLLFNATTLHIGGSLQVAVNFIEQAIFDAAIDWHFAISQRVYEELSRVVDISANDRRLTVFATSTAQNLASRRKLRELESALSPQAVFTLFGPAYVRFQAPHLLGAAEGWVVCPTPEALALVPWPIARSRLLLSVTYKKYWFRAADAWIVESPAVINRMKKIVQTDENNIAVVPNGCRDIFKSITTRFTSIEADNVINALYLCAYYPHKNIEIVPKVAAHLRDLLPHKRIEFTLTIDKNMAAGATIYQECQRLNVSDRVHFIGRTALSDIASLYEQSHFAFIPSLMEVFSANYSEALTCGLPIVTTRLAFATELLGNMAAYFAPNDPMEAARSIVNLLQSPKETRARVEAGIRFASSLPNSKEKYDLYTQIIRKLLDRKYQPPHIF
jgi:glycosyltransferase involved in cell wall biosynthesis